MSYKVTLIDQGLIRYKQNCLFDVTGMLLRDDQGEPMTLYSLSMQRAIYDGRLHIHHTLLPGYRYITTNEMDHDIFVRDCRYGSEDPFTKYYVYLDEDVDFNTGLRMHTMVNWQLRQ